MLLAHEENKFGRIFRVDPLCTQSVDKGESRTPRNVKRRKRMQEVHTTKATSVTLNYETKTKALQARGHQLKQPKQNEPYITYDVSIGKSPSCSCPIGLLTKRTVCKHILFVYLYALGTTESCTTIQQIELTKAELKPRY